jgi:serine/threonine protein phosphatase PrpC
MNAAAIAQAGNEAGRKRSAVEFARMEAQAYKAGLRPTFAEKVYSPFRNEKGARIQASVFQGLGGRSAAKFGNSHVAAARSRRNKAINAHEMRHGEMVWQRSSNQAKINKKILNLTKKAATEWTSNDNAIYTKYRTRYQNLVNQLARNGGVTTAGRLRGMGRVYGTRLRTGLGNLGLSARRGLAMGRLAGNITAAAAARGYGGLARGLGTAAGYGYRGGHAVGNYGRSRAALRGMPNIKEGTVAELNAAKQKMKTALSTAARKSALALANPNNTNISNANVALARAAKTSAAAGSLAGVRAAGLMAQTVNNNQAPLLPNTRTRFQKLGNRLRGRR